MSGVLAEQNGLLPINANSSGSITMFAIRSFMISEASKAWSGCTLSRSASINKIGHPSPRLDKAHKCWFGCQATHVKVWPKRWPRIGAGKTAMPWWEEWTSVEGVEEWTSGRVDEWKIGPTQCRIDKR